MPEMSSPRGWYCQVSNVVLGVEGSPAAGDLSRIGHCSVFSQDPKGTSLEGLCVGRVDGQGARAGVEAEGLESGWSAGLGAVPPVCAREDSAAQRHAPVVSLYMGTTSRHVPPLPSWPGSAMDFELAGRKQLQRQMSWCPLGFESSPKL